MHARITKCHGGIALLVIALLLPTKASGQQHFPADPDLQGMLHALVEEGATPGIVFGVVESDGTRRIVSEGSAGPGARPLGAESVFEIGSITKTFTGTVLADMVARGEVALADPVSRYLPDSVRVPGWEGREITLLDLATHRSGLPGVPDDFLPGDLSDPYADVTIEGLYGFLSTHELRREPGSEAEYSNVGFGLLGHALARAAGLPYRELLQERVLEPLGLESTGYVVEGELSGRLAKGHKHGRVVRYWSTTEAMDGAGGLYSTAADLLKYLEASVGPPRTAPERAMREAHRARRPFDEDEEIGLGWRTLREGDRRIVQHGGTSGGFTARIAFEPERGVGFIRLTNTRDFTGDPGLELLRKGPAASVAELDLRTGAPAAPQVLDLPLGAGEMARYEGEYVLDAGGRTLEARIHGEDGALVARIHGGPASRLLHQGDHVFLLDADTDHRMVFAMEADSATAVTLNQRGRIVAAGRRAGAPPAPGAGAEIRDLPVSDQEIARYEGTYLLEIGDRTLELRIFGQDDRLVSRAAGQRVAPLRYQGDHVFVPDFSDAVRLVFTVEEGRATRVTLHQGGAVIHGDREPPSP